MPEQTSDGRDIQGRETVEHLLIPPPQDCWWCGVRPASTGEHKFKRTDLIHLMSSDDSLIWGDGEGNSRSIRGKSGTTRDRYKVVKFPKSLCERCNNARSKSFDGAYDVYARRLPRGWLNLEGGINLRRIFGREWEEPSLHLARYYGKHFGCRMVRAGVPVPSSLRTFLDGDPDMADAHMALVTTDEVRGRLRTGLSISADYVEANRQKTGLVRCVLAAYIGPIGVRYEWKAEGILDRSQFFHYPCPIINDFKDDMSVFEGRPRPQRRVVPMRRWTAGA